MKEQEYKAYRKEGSLYVSRLVSPRFTLVFQNGNGVLVEEEELKRYTEQSDTSEALQVARWLREAGDCAQEFLQSNR